MITVKAPGKLYIAGEYAVVEPGCPAILVGLNRYVYATIEGLKNMQTVEQVAAKRGKKVSEIL